MEFKTLKKDLPLCTKSKCEVTPKAFNVNIMDTPECKVIEMFSRNDFNL